MQSIFRESHIHGAHIVVRYVRPEVNESAFGEQLRRVVRGCQGEMVKPYFHDWVVAQVFIRCRIDLTDSSACLPIDAGGRVL
ncbi:Uncharacterised protein [Mycobacteroides abscessus subsp. abscessus]|nr:Uncharacterised protein [Mycobacteroides abscessus subsp. abscessus]